MLIELHNNFSTPITITKLARIKGGTWALVHRAKLFHTNNIVIKQYGDTTIDNSLQAFSPSFAQELLRDIKQLKDLLLTLGFNIPRTYFFGLAAKNIQLTSILSHMQHPNIPARINTTNKSVSNQFQIILLEESTGISIREIIRSNIPESIKQNVINEAIQVITKLPEGVELDLNPGNITYDFVDNKFYVIDFMPPRFWSATGDYYRNIAYNFPSILISEEKYKNVDIRSQYITTSGRLDRYKFYVEQLLVQNK